MLRVRRAVRSVERRIGAAAGPPIAVRGRVACVCTCVSLIDCDVCWVLQCFFRIDVPPLHTPVLTPTLLTTHCPTHTRAWYANTHTNIPCVHILHMLHMHITQHDEYTSGRHIHTCMSQQSCTRTHDMFYQAAVCTLLCGCIVLCCVVLCSAVFCVVVWSLLCCVASALQSFPVISPATSTPSH